MNRTPEHTPVIVGVGHVTNHPEAPDDTVEPAQLLADAIDEAAGDAGLSATDLAEAESLDVVNLVSWSYGDPCGEVARRAGIAPARQVYSNVGGEQPTTLLDAAARRVAHGDGDFAVIAGGEAMRARTLYDKAGRTPPWTPPGSPPAALDPGTGTRGIAPYGLTEPSNVYPLFENAYRAARGRSFTEEQHRSAQIWSSFSEVAARTPGAWADRPRSPAEIATPGMDNRMIAYPYPKLMCALLDVDQSASVILMSAARARRLGIPDKQWVYPWGGAAAQDTAEVIERTTYSGSPAMRRVLADTLAMRSLSPEDVDLFELYSCFPVVPKLAADVLDLDGGKPWTVAGGLTFYGGPLSAYMTCATVNMVRALRRGDGAIGLLYGNGEYVTKHHGLLLATEQRSDSTYPVDNETVRQQNVEALPAPKVVEAADGWAQIETYTVVYGRDGAPQYGVVIGRLSDGSRFVANTPGDDETLAMLTDPEIEAVGRAGRVTHTGDGNRFHPTS